MSRAVVYDTFGGPEVLELREVPEPHAGVGEVRVRVAAVGLNPMDWVLTSMPEMAQQFGITLPSGFATDFAGTVDEVGEGISDFAVGDRVYGAATGRAAADFVVVDPSGADTLRRTPAGISDAVASTLAVAGMTASAALAAVGVKAGDTVLIGGAAGGVGVFAIQLAKLAGARVIGTSSEGTFDFLRQFGVDPVAYGPGLEDRVRAMTSDGVSAAADLFGTETAEAALALGVLPERISTIAAPNPPEGVRATGGINAQPQDLKRITDAAVAGELTVPIAATFPIEQIREAVQLQAGRRVHGKIVVNL
ncbi:NADP-dependent oxidoreductase [Streptantibioticus ferralitis]|uniref:NADP-dependent oxidoreductase n=1 Tax=Streptantibioticus ferralitis TaxID=236510 RepID=A0ABT5ZAZ6_9ACTN|nr:NADP-dependent oxidoreductase [Streptantibioticus ferralitis]MDF2261004.1 NADP-dependent oxidoreductase [Streptantibioticus ferralitis]